MGLNRKKIILILLSVLILGLFLIPNFSFAQENKFCLVYFTYIGCPNCAYTDPIVLSEWTKKYSHLVIIEYMWQHGDWQDPNSQFFGEYAKEYKIQAAVPQICISKNNIRAGAISVPNTEGEIKAKKFNPCPLPDNLVPFEELNLEKLPARPKIWANERVLISLGGNNWLFQWNGEKIPEEMPEILKRVKFETLKPQKVEFSGIAFSSEDLIQYFKRLGIPFSPDDYVPYAEFENAIKINISGNSSEEEKPDSNLLKELLFTNDISVVDSTEPTEPTEPDLKKDVIKLPFIGKIKTEKFSLPIITFLIALADGFNPCAFFVLTFLLAALLGLTGARKKILLVGGIFVFFSALFYFLFMAVLLNVFQLGRGMTILTLIAGLIAIFAGIINIKDYFFFQRGISLTLPKTGKLKFFERVKNLSLEKSTWALIISTTIIAGTINIYELLCTFGFPMIYTRILTLRELSSWQYYLFLIFYNLIYIIPFTIIVLIFAITLGRKTFSQIWVRRLKLISGFMILFLGLILLFKPEFLESILTAFEVLIFAIVISGVIIFIDFLYKKRNL